MSSELGTHWKRKWSLIPDARTGVKSTKIAK
ncbi:hypothetical protein PVAP13_9KG215470 [Panicum virgatum]|uniref:Uncharacterized protein n=1 Tax=Panicum virgatum TaxID=38727 RepID=A0A8T0NJZ1_PANVG|nr:hypothetical protein PVAP13_9KG215470 [Panicum virgatum]